MSEVTMSEHTEPKTRTITLTDRPPVRIVEDEWPILARARWWEGQHEQQANRRCWINVRQHADGRTIVYGGFDSAFTHEEDLRAGEYLAAMEPRYTVEAIHRVARRCNAERIAQDVIADLPPEQI